MTVFLPTSDGDFINFELRGARARLGSGGVCGAVPGKRANQGGGKVFESGVRAYRKGQPPIDGSRPSS